MSAVATKPDERKQKRRNVALALVLAAMVILFFLITVAKLSGNVAP